MNSVSNWLNVDSTPPELSPLWFSIPILTLLFFRIAFSFSFSLPVTVVFLHFVLFMQVHRLESAIREEEESLKDGGATATGGKKRGRDSEDTGNPDGGDLIGAVEKLREMNVQQLREEAVRRGISSNGLKKELLKRLCEDVEKEEGEDAEDETDGMELYFDLGDFLYCEESVAFGALLLVYCDSCTSR